MKEKPAWKINGFIIIAVMVALAVWAVWGIIHGMPLIPVVAIVLLIVCGSSLVMVQPNMAAVITFFGRYTGCIRQNGIWMIVPFSSSQKVSLRILNFNSEKLKVNDINGNPIEIATVVVFRVVEAARATFDVEDYRNFVQIQSETALRHIAAQYPYDNFEDDGLSLRSNADEVSRQLLAELKSRLEVAGVEVLESRLTHLAYATEIANAMLQRQQAAAILAARKIIVDGAVGMAQMAISQLEQDHALELDGEQRVHMINNLMVAIVSDRASQPVINVGNIQ